MTGTASERFPAEMLQFIAPGFMHAMGNCLFSIHGHAQLLRGGDTEIARDKSAIVKASERALHALDVFRYVIGDPGPEVAPQAGILLHRLCDHLRVPLREYGLIVRYLHASSQTPVHVDGIALSQVVVEVTRQLATHLPGGVEGAIEIDLSAQRPDGVTVTFAVQNDPSHLPFPFDLDSVIACARPVLDRHGATADCAKQQLSVNVPAGTHA